MVGSLVVQQEAQTGTHVAKALYVPLILVHQAELVLNQYITGTKPVLNSLFPCFEIGFPFETATGFEVFLSG